jgi:hypothetical protein
MADHEFHGTVSAQPATEADHLAQKSQVDTAVAGATNRANHTGTQATETIDGLDAFVDERVQAVVDAAPAALDTLRELAEALGEDPNFAATVTSGLGDLDTRLDALEAAPGGGGSFAQNVGDAVASSFTVNHGLGSQDVGVVVIRLSDFQTVYPVVKRPSTGSVLVDFGTFVPLAGSHRVIVVAH